MQLRRSTKLLLPLLMINVGLWLIGYAWPLHARVAIPGASVTFTPYNGKTHLLTHISSRLSPTATINSLDPRRHGQTCHDHFAPGVGFRIERPLYYFHIHHWVVTLLIALMWLAFHLHRRHTKTAAENRVV